MVGNYLLHLTLYWHGFKRHVTGYYVMTANPLLFQPCFVRCAEEHRSMRLHYHTITLSVQMFVAGILPLKVV